MAPTYPTPRLTNGTIVDDTDWDQLGDNIDDLDARMIAAVSVSNALRADLGTWSGGTAISRLGSLETVTGTGASSKFGSGVGTGSNVTTGSATSQLTDLRSRATAVEGRATALEAARASGWWKATDSTQNIAYAPGSSSNTPLYATAVTTPVGLTMAAGTGIVTVGAGYAGWYQLSAQFDINAANATTHLVVLSLTNGAGSVTYGTDTAYYPTTAWTAHNATALVYLAAAATFKASLSVYTGTGSGNYTNTGPGTDRTHLKAAWLRA